MVLGWNVLNMKLSNMDIDKAKTLGLPVDDETHVALYAWMKRNYKFTNKLRLEVEKEENKVYRSEVAKYYGHNIKR